MHEINVSDFLDYSFQSIVASSGEGGKQLIAVYRPALKTDCYLIWYDMNIDAQCEIIFNFREAIEFYNSK